MSTTTNVRKGSRIHAHWETVKAVCLAGVQDKRQLTVHDVVGVVKHFRGDHPTNPTKVRIYVDPDEPCAEPRVQAFGCTCPGGHVEVDPQHIIDDEGRGVSEMTAIPKGAT